MAEEKILTIKLLGDAKSRKAIEDLQISVDKLRRQRLALNKQEKQGLITSREASKRRALLNAQLKATTTNLNALTRQQLIANKAIKKGAGLTTSITKGFANFALQMGAATIAISVISGAIRGAITTIKEFDEAVTNLAKVTGLSKDAARDLAKELIKIDTRTSVQALLELGTAAGRLGLEGQELIDFVKQTDKAFVALGDSLEGSAEDIGLTLGKLASNFQLEEKFGIGEVINKVGSALNELGASSKAQEGAIVDFTKRLSGVASQAGLTLPEVAALGALFDESGQSIEVAASTFNKLLPAIGKNIEKFAGIAGVNIDEFREKVEKDAFGALLLVAEGAKSNQKGLEGLSKTLENYGINSSRAASIVGILSSKTDRLTELQAIANKGFEEGTSLTDEFNLKNQTLTATTEKLSKAWDVYVISLEDGSGVISDVARTIVDDLTAGIAQMSGQVDEANEKFSFFGTILEVLRINFKVMKAIILTTFIIPVREGVKAITALSNVLGTVFRPQIEAITGFFNDTVLPAFRGFRDLITDTAKTVLAFGSTVLNKLGFDIDLSGKAISLFNEIIGQTAEQTDKATEAIVKSSEATEENTSATEENITATERQVAAKQRLADQLLKTQEALVKQLDELEIQAIEDDREQEEARAIFDFEQKLLRITSEGEIETELRVSLKEKLESDLAGIDQKFAKIKTDLDKKAADDELRREEVLRAGKFALAQEGLNLVRAIAGEETKIGKAAAIASRAFAVAQAAIAIGLGFANTAKIGFPQNIPLLISFVAQTAGLIASIKSQQFHKGAILEGSSHANGGIPFSVGGRVGFEAEGGEAIINKVSTQKHRGLLSAINMDGGGVAFNNGGLTPIHRFQGGATIPSPVFSTRSNVVQSQRQDQEVLADLISEGISERINDLQVINVVSDTSERQLSVRNTESEASL